MARDIVAVALLTQPELQGLGAAFGRAWPIENAPYFTGLLQAIDEADRLLWRDRDKEDLRVSSPSSRTLA